MSAVFRTDFVRSFAIGFVVATIPMIALTGLVH